MKKRIISLLAAVGMALGLMVTIQVAAAPSASAAYPATGQHTLQFACDDGLYHSTLKFTYTMTYLNTKPNTDIRRYTFALLTATYTGTVGLPNPPRGPQIQIYSNGWILNAAFGGSSNTQKYPFGTTPETGQALAPITTNIASTGSFGMPWNSFTVESNPATPSSNQIGRVYWDSNNAFNHPSCAVNTPQYQWKLSNPDAPREGAQHTTVLACNNANGTDSVDASFDIFPLSGDTYGFQITGMGMASTEGFSGYLTMVLEDSTGALIDVGPSTPLSGLINLPSGSVSYSVPDGVLNYTFPQVSFTAYQGGIVPTVAFTFHRDTPQELDCTVSWQLMDTWDTSQDQYSNQATISFNTCTADPQPAGNLLVTSFWDLNGNGDYVRPNHVIISNVSPVTIKLHTGTGVQNPKFQAGVFGTQDQVFMKTNATTADRNWAPGQIKNLNITNPGIWAAVVAGLPGTAPADLKIPSTLQVGAFAMDWDVFDAAGTVACPSGTADLEDVVATSDL